MKSNWYFTSDLHLDHRNIIKYSGRTYAMTDLEFDEYQRRLKAGDSRMKDFRLSDESIAYMNDYIIDKINTRVKERDKLVIAGDFYLKHDLQRLLNLRHKIKCQYIIYVWGNHDTWWRERCPPYLFNEYHDATHITVNSQRIWLSHYAHVVWPKQHRGCWHLYGHSHGSLNAWMKQHMGDAKCIDIGIDTGNGYYPYSFEEIYEIMKTRKGHEVDHHTTNIGDDD